MKGPRHSHLARAVLVAHVLPDEPGGDGVERPWDGAAITPTTDLDTGITGAMTGSTCPDGICQIADGVVDGRQPGARP